MQYLEAVNKPDSTLLYIVALPIDSRWDVLDPRVIDAIKGCDLLVAEERRPALRLLAASDSRDTEVIYINEHSSDNDREAVVRKVMSVKRAALVSDAGTPCIADPDYRVVDQCIKRGAIVRSVGATSSIIGALSVSGFKADSFIYLGFPPRDKALRKKFFAEINSLKSTAVILERPYSLSQTLSDLVVVKKEISVSINIGSGNIGSGNIGTSSDVSRNDGSNDDISSEDELHIRGSASEIAKRVGSIKAAFVVVINYK